MPCCAACPQQYGCSVSPTASCHATSCALSGSRPGQVSGKGAEHPECTCGHHGPKPLLLYEHDSYRGLWVIAGKVSLKMLMVYVNAMGGKLRFSILMSWFLLVELCRVAATVWLSYWTGISDKAGDPSHPRPYRLD